MIKEQKTFDFLNEKSTIKDSPKLYYSNKNELTLKKLISESVGFLAVISNLQKYGYDWKVIKMFHKKNVEININEEIYVIDNFVKPNLIKKFEFLKQSV